MELVIPANLSHTGKAYRKPVGIDACIAPLVKALNDGGIATIASCCGHGDQPGNIALADGRELIILPDFEAARAMDAMLLPRWPRRLWNWIKAEATMWAVLLGRPTSSAVWIDKEQSNAH